MAEIHFPRDTAFRKQFFVPDSFAHPAKMDSQLLMWIVLKYTEAGETILDPMAGSGTTMLACNVGRNVILIELEEKFCKMMRDNWELVKMKPQLGCEMGTCQIIQGDARNLEGLLADKIITSPPYAEADISQTHMTSNKRGDPSNPNYRPSWKRKIAEGYCETKRPYADKIITSPPYAEDFQRTDDYKPNELPNSFTKHMGEYSQRRHPCPAIGSDNIGSLPYGDIDSIITSPPYAESKEIHDLKFMENIGAEQSLKAKRGLTKAHFFTPEAKQREAEKRKRGETDNPQNIGNKPYGDIDSIITSPPYEEAMGKKHHSPRADKLAKEKSNPVTYTDRIDSIITSPPYESQIHKGSGEWSESSAGRLLGGTQSSGGKMLGVPQGEDYTKSPGNIGNLKSDTYLEAMLQVYQQCFKALKDGGLMILVTKNFIRNKKVVRLDTDTIKLCEQAGFSYVERHWRKLPAQSFWRVIYHKKHPEVEQIRFEDVLVFRKQVMELND